MGEVWAARNLTLQAECAIKLVRAEFKEDSARLRLFAEARASAQLVHPAIVRIFDVDETHDNEPFVVMELLKGESLAQALKRQMRLDPVVCVQTLLPIADALCFAHKRGVVHRDLKPDNVFLSNVTETQLQPKLVDFGLVKVEQVELESKLTQAGTVVGSPEYMSPEQARGQNDVDQRTDIWSFSVMLFEALSGHMPFKGDNYNALLMSIVGEEPPNLEDVVRIDERLATIVRVGLLKDRDQRWQSMTEVGRALAEWLLAHDTPHDITGASVEARWIAGSERVTLVSPQGALVDRDQPTVVGERIALPTTGSGTVVPADFRPAPKRKALLMALGGAATVLAAVAAFSLGGNDSVAPAPEPSFAAAAAPAPSTVAVLPAADTSGPATSAPTLATGVSPAEEPAVPRTASGSKPRSKPQPKSAPKPSRKNKSPKSESGLDLKSPY
jgi:serine/threonine-protein kinase